MGWENMDTEIQKYILWERDIPFQCPGDTFIPAMTGYHVQDCKKAVLVCPGGGYRYKAEHEGAPVARVLNAAGISAFVLDYRVAPCHCKAPMNDALRAIRLLRSAGYEKVAVLGFSAGGHVACCAAVHYRDAYLDGNDPVDRFDSRPDGLISCYSVISMTEYAHPGSVQQLLGEACGDRKLEEYFSAQLHVTGDTPPAFIWYTSADGSVPVENSLMLAEAYAENGVPFELHVFPGGHHGMGLAADDPVISAWAGLCVKFCGLL